MEGGVPGDGFPKRYTAEQAPAAVLALVARLVPSLLDGDHPALAALREQFRRARIKEVELTGAGFYVDFDVPVDAPLAVPANLTGGHASISLDVARHGAGCVLFVRDGRLAMFEGYTYDEPWPEHACVTAVDEISPIQPTEAPR
jgi:hypothetical protein